jgi:hypothetical protein
MENEEVLEAMKKEILIMGKALKSILRMWRPNLSATEAKTRLFNASEEAKDALYGPIVSSVKEGCNLCGGFHSVSIICMDGHITTKDCPKCLPWSN